MGGLTRALQTAHQDDTGRTVGSRQSRRLAAHQVSELLLDDLDDHLRRGEALHHLRADSRLDYTGGEVLGDLVVDVRLKQGQTDLPHRFFDVRFAELAFVAQLLKGSGQLFAESFKCHRGSPAFLGVGNHEIILLSAASPPVR